MQKQLLSFLNAPKTARLLLMLAVLYLCTSFSVVSTPPLPNASTTGEWVFHKTLNNVDFYHMLTSCDGKRVVLLKFNNKNNHRVKVSWQELFTTQLEKRVEGFNGKKQLIIGPGETFSAGCNDDKVEELLISPMQVKPTYIAEIRAFEYKDVDVTLAF